MQDLHKKNKLMFTQLYVHTVIPWSSRTKWRSLCLHTVFETDTIVRIEAVFFPPTAMDPWATIPFHVCTVHIYQP